MSRGLEMERKRWSCVLWHSRTSGHLYLWSSWWSSRSSRSSQPMGVSVVPVAATLTPFLILIWAVSSVRSLEAQCVQLISIHLTHCLRTHHIWFIFQNFLWHCMPLPPSVYVLRVCEREYGITFLITYLMRRWEGFPGNAATWQGCYSWHFCVP